MRTILSLRSALAVLLMGTTFHAFPQSQVLMNITNQVWRYNQTGSDLGDTGWQSTNYDDSAWPQGRSVLALEDAPGVTPYINTVLYLTYPGNTSQTITYYFRTHFQFSGVGSRTLLFSTNFIDDGAVFYINGTEIMRWSMPEGPINGSTLARVQQLGDGVRFTLQLTNGGRALVSGDNVLAVEVHQNSALSADVTWGATIVAVTAYPPEITQQPSPTNVLQGRSATLTILASGAPGPAYQWFRTDTGTPIAGATGPSYTIQNMDSSQAGLYHARVENPYGSVDSTAVNVSYTPDGDSPFLLSAVGLSSDPRTVVLQFNESIMGALDPSFYQLAFANGDPGPPTVSMAAYNASSNQIFLTLDAPLDPARLYDLILDSGGSLHDYFGNTFFEPLRKRVIFPAALQLSWNTNRTVTLSWTAGLQPYYSERVTGPWTPLTVSSNPADLPASASSRFFVLRP